MKGIWYPSPESRIPGSASLLCIRAVVKVSGKGARAHWEWIAVMTQGMTNPTLLLCLLSIINDIELPVLGICRHDFRSADLQIAMYCTQNLNGWFGWDMLGLQILESCHRGHPRSRSLYSDQGHPPYPLNISLRLELSDSWLYHLLIHACIHRGYWLLRIRQHSDSMTSKIISEVSRGRQLNLFRIFRPLRGSWQCFDCDCCLSKKIYPEGPRSYPCRIQKRPGRQPWHSEMGILEDRP